MPPPLPSPIPTPPRQTNKQQTQDKYGKKFDELSAHERVTIGGTLKGGEMADPGRAPPAPDVKFGENYPAEPARKQQQGQGQREGQ